MDTNLEEELVAFLQKNQSPLTISAVKLRQAWKDIASPRVLEHSDNIIYDKKDPRIVIVYVDSSHWSAELNAEKEIYKKQLSKALQLAGDSQLHEVRFHVTRRSALRHMFKKSQSAATGTEYVQPVRLSPEEDRHAREKLLAVSDPELRTRLYKAMKANLEWKKGIEISKEP